MSVALHDEHDAPDAFGAVSDTAPGERERPSRGDLLDELDHNLATVVHTAVEQLLARSYPDAALLDTIVKATALRLEAMRERDLPRTTDTEENTHG